VETSIVWKGANPHTSGAMRSLDDFMASIVDVEMDDDEIRRAISYFTDRLPCVDRSAEFAERDRADRERLERLKRSKI
jgi:hypothetical protein